MPISLSRNYDNGGSHEAQTRLRFDFDEPMICSEHNKLNIVMQMLRYTSLQTIKYFRAAYETPIYLPITCDLISST